MASLIGLAVNGSALVELSKEDVQTLLHVVPSYRRLHPNIDLAPRAKDHFEQLDRAMVAANIAQVTAAMATWRETEVREGEPSHA